MLGKKFVVALAAMSIFNLSNANIGENITSMSKVYAADASNVNLAEQRHEEGLQLYNKKDYEGAIAKFSEAIRLNPNFASPYSHRGAAYCELGKTSQAIADCTKAIQFGLDYVNIEAYNTRGAAYCDLGNYSQAIDDCTKSIQLDSEYMYSYFNRGTAYYKSKNYTKAIEDFSKAIELSPNSSGAYYSRGLCYKELGKNDLAEKDFEKANSVFHSSRPLGYTR